MFDAAHLVMNMNANNHSEMQVQGAISHLDYDEEEPQY